MGHPVVDEFCRIRTLGTYRLVVFRRHQRLMRAEVMPMLEERDRLVEENAKLKAQVAFFEEAQAADAPEPDTVAAPRKRGRPKKVELNAGM